MKKAQALADKEKAEKKSERQRKNGLIVISALILCSLALVFLQLKKVRKFIEDALKVIAAVTIAIETVEALQRSVEAARKAAEATRKASVIGASLNPVSAALGFLQESVIKKAEEEEKDAKDALNVAPILVTTFEDFCGRSLDRISQAIAQRAMKDSIGN